MCFQKGTRTAIVIVICTVFLAKQVSSGKLLMFLVDGFRWDYLDIHGPLETLPGFQRLVASGVKTEYTKPCFPSESLVNFYSLTTGLYPESHGIVSNFIYDHERDAYLKLFQLPNLRWTFWWDSAEPIWINAERNMKPAHMYYWAGCEVELGERKASVCIPVEEPPWSTLHDSVHTGVQSLFKGTSELIGIYVEHVDTEGHISGPISKAIKESVHHVDDLLLYALNELNKYDLRDEVDVMVFSDHGMAETNHTRLINISNYIDLDDLLEVMNKGAIMELWIQDGKLGKDDSEPYTTKGTHGYDNTEPDMRGIFLASGPHFQKGETVAPIDVVDLYQLMCHVLEVEPRPHNGSWANVQDMLADRHCLPATPNASEGNGNC